MDVLYPGHRYDLRQLDGDDRRQLLQFVQRAPLHPPCAGTTNQEVCRALIDRIRVLDAEKRWPPNDAIIHHLSEVIRLHEVRALTMKYRKVGVHNSALVTYQITHHIRSHKYRGIPIDQIPVGEDGHWELG